MDKTQNYDANSGQKKSGDDKIMIELMNKKEELSQNAAVPHETRIIIDHPKGAFAVEEHERNDEKHPHWEATNTLPILIRRAESVEIMPWPFRTTSQLLVCTYLTCCCCCLCGVFATKAAFQAKMLRNKSLYEAAAGQARKAIYWMLAAVISGSLIIIIIGTVIGLHVAERKK